MSVIKTSSGYYTLTMPDGEQILFDLPMNPATPPQISAPPTFVLTSTAVHGNTATVHFATVTDADTVIHYLMRCDNVIVAGVADNYEYTFDGAVDDEQSIYVRVVAASAWGSKTEQSAVVVPKYAPPVASGTIPGQSSTVLAGAVLTIDGAMYFTGGGRKYTVTAPAAVDIDTGVVTISRNDPVASTTITLTATNSGGSVTQTFNLTITGTAPTPTLPALLASEIKITWELDPTGELAAGAYTWMFELLGSGTTVTALTRLLWAGTPAASQQLGSGLHPTRAHPTVAKKYIARSYSSGNPDGYGTASWLALTSSDARVGTTIDHCFRWTDDPTGSVTQSAAEYSALSASIPKTVVLGDVTPPTPVVTASKRIAIISPDEYATIAQGFLQGDTLQNMHDVDWCYDDPDWVYQIQDTGSIWRSSDHGRTWELPHRLGLLSFQGLGVAVDPRNHLHVLANMGGNYESNKPYQGIYRSIDGGEHFTYTGVAGKLNARRGTTHTMAFGGTATLNGRTTKALVIADGQVEGTAPTQLMNMAVSTNCGDDNATFTIVGQWDRSQYGYGKFMRGDPSNANRFYIGTENGFYRIVTSGTSMPTITKLSLGTNGLPAGGYASPVVVSADGNTIFCARGGGGIYRSTDGGATFARRGTFTNFMRAFVDPYDYNKCIAMGGESSADQQPFYCTNLLGAATFTKVAVNDVQKRTAIPAQSYTPLMCGQFNNIAFHTNGDFYLHCRATSAPRSANQYRMTAALNNPDWGKAYTIANRGFCGMNVGFFGPAQYVCKDENTFALCALDTGPFVTVNGGLGWMRAFDGHAPADFGIQDWSTYGIAFNPSNNTVLAAVGDKQPPPIFRIIVNKNPDGSIDSFTSTVVHGAVSGATYSIILGNGTGANTTWFFGNKKSTNDGVSWIVMSGLPADVGSPEQRFRVCASTQDATVAGQAIFAYDIIGNNMQKTFYRSVNQGGAWTHVLTTPYSIKQPGLKYGAIAAHPTDKDLFFTRGPESGDNAYTVRRWNLTSGSGPTSRTYVEHNIFGTGNGVPASFNGGRAYIARIAVDARNPNVVSVQTIYSGNTRVFRTANFGDGNPWEELGPTIFPAASNLNSIFISPFTGDLVVGGSNGTFVVPPPYAQSNPPTLYSRLTYPSYLVQ